MEVGLPPPVGVLKFNVDGVDRRKLGLVGIGRALHNDRGEILYMFFKSVGIKDSNDSEELMILEALRIFSCSFQDLVGDPANLGSWVNLNGPKPWKLQ